MISVQEARAVLQKDSLSDTEIEKILVGLYYFAEKLLDAF